MSKLLERLRSKKDDNRNRGNRKGEGPKPMHSKKKQKEFEKEQGKKELERFHKTGDPNPQEPILKKGYINQTSMDSAVKRWNSSTPLMQRDVSAPNDNPGEYSSDMMRTIKPEILKETTKAREQSVKDNEAKATKKKKSKEKATEITNTLGKALEHFATGKASETATERKAKKKSEEAKREKTKVKNVFDEKLDNTITTDSDEGKKEVVKVDSSTDSTSPTERKGEPKKGGKAKAVSKTLKKPVSGRKPT